MTTTTPAPDETAQDDRFSPGLEIRSFEVRAVDTAKREVTAIAVPWDQEIRVQSWFSDYFESVARGACEAREGEPKLFWLHRSAIGKVTSYRDTDAGWEITARISETPTGDEAYTLLRDGVIDRMSIGFEPIEHTITKDEDGKEHVKRTRIRVREVSLVPFPAYDGAAVTKVRHDQPEKENTTMTATTTSAPATDDTGLRQAVEDIQRSVELLRQERHEERAPALRFATPGALLKAIADGDDEAVREYNETLERAWDPAGVALEDMPDSAKTGWVGWLNRFVEETSRLRSLFRTGTLPSTGNVLEFGVIEPGTVDVDEQENEGDDLTFGKIAVDTDTAPVKTFGGYTRQSFQAIQRSPVNVVDAHFRAMALAARKRRNATFRTHYNTVVTGSTVDPITVADSTSWADWIGAIIDGAAYYEDLGLELEALVADKETFKTLATLETTGGQPLMVISGTGANTVGTVNPKALRGSLAGLLVVPNLKQTTPRAEFVNGDAIRAYASPIARLQDDNVINLSRDTSVYYYEALATEFPEAIVPIELDPAGD